MTSQPLLGVPTGTTNHIERVLREHGRQSLDGLYNLGLPKTGGLDALNAMVRDGIVRAHACGSVKSVVWKEYELA